eukprot:4583304-Amphidinium_carterae.1
MTPRPSVMPKLVQCSPRSSSQEEPSASALQLLQNPTPPLQLLGLIRHAGSALSSSRMQSQPSELQPPSRPPTEPVTPSGRLSLLFHQRRVYASANSTTSLVVVVSAFFAVRGMCAGSVAVPITRGLSITSRSDQTSALHLVSSCRRVMSQLATEWFRRTLAQKR